MTLADRAAEHRVRAQLALRQQRWPEAEIELEAYLKINPNDALAWNNLGVTLERQRKERAALEAYAQATALRPSPAVSGTNLVGGMQRYLGFAAAVAIWKLIDIGLHLVPIPDDVRSALLVASLVLLALGALVFYQRRREILPDETWRAYKSEMVRTRRIRYGGIAFVFIGFVAFAVLLVALVGIVGTGNDGLVLLLIGAGLLWLIVARYIWRYLVAPILLSGGSPTPSRR